MKRTALLLSVILILSLVGCGNKKEDKTAGGQSGGTGAEIPQVSVKMGLAPYADHTDSSIAIENDWFKEVGIDLEWTAADPDKFIGMLSAGSLDIITGCESNFIPALDKLETKAFVLNDAFFGYAIIAQPDSGAKSYAQFREEGAEPEEAVIKTMEQLKGKKYAYSSESGLKGFIDLCFEKGGMTREDVESLVQEDANGLVLMMNKEADFQTGGVPTRVTLEGKGFKPILTTMDLLETAEASPDSKELLSVVHGSWNCTKEYADKNHDTLLRLASVKFRVNQYIKEHPDESAEIHAGFLNKIAGTELTTDEIKVSYNTLSPFYTFDEQESWFHDESDPLYWSYVSESLIKMYEKEGVLKEGEHQASDFMMAQDIYDELAEYKNTAEKNLAQLENAEGDALKLKEEAQKQFDIFNYLDAARLSEAALSGE